MRPSEALAFRRGECLASIQAFNHTEVPASFVETYDGDFDEVFATAADGRTVGFIQPIGAGRVLVLGAAFAANTLDDLDILDQIAVRMDCPPLFTLSDWADVSLSSGENGSFLFVTNYQDDPIETTIALAGVPLFGGRALTLPARRDPAAGVTATTRSYSSLPHIGSRRSQRRRGAVGYKNRAGRVFR